MFETRVTEKIDHLKPIMKTLKSLKGLTIIVGDTVVIAKIDGQFTKVSYADETSWTLNKWGFQRSDFPAINEFNSAMIKTEIKQVEVMAETYAVNENGVPVKLPDLQSAIKSKDTARIERLRLGIWDLKSINGRDVTNSYAWRLEEVKRWLNGCEKVQVLPFIIPKSLSEVEAFWQTYVEQKKYEGIVARTNNDIFKLKPNREVDAVIVGINKIGDKGALKLFGQEKVTSIKFALMENDGTLVELCDCASGIDVPLRSKLWQLMDYKVHEDKEAVWIKPLFICQLEYTDTYDRECRRFRFDGEKYVYVEPRPFVTLREPRLLHIRDDKNVTPQDLRLEQIPITFGWLYGKKG